jgi:hypothetical protein
LQTHQGQGKTNFPPWTYKWPLFSLHRAIAHSPQSLCIPFLTRNAGKAHEFHLPMFPSEDGPPSEDGRCTSKLRTLRQAETLKRMLFLTYVRHRFKATSTFRAGSRQKHHVLRPTFTCRPRTALMQRLGYTSSIQGRFSPPASSCSHRSGNMTQKVTDTYSLLSTCIACAGPSLLEPENPRREWHRERVSGCPVTFFIDRSVFRQTDRWIKPHRFPGEIALQSRILMILRPCEL